MRTSRVEANRRHDLPAEQRGTGARCTALAPVIVSLGIMLLSGLLMSRINPWLRVERAAIAADSEDGGAARAETGPAPVVVLARTDRDHVSVGTPFRYIVEVRTEEDVEALVPVLGGRLGEFTVTDFGEEPPRQTGGTAVLTRWYTLVAYRPGYLLIPGLTVQYRAPGGELVSAHGKDVGIRVESLVDQNPEVTDIRSIPDPVSLPFDWTPVLVVVGIIGGLIGLGFVAARLLSPRRRIVTEPAPRPPDEVALEELARLRRWRLSDPAERAAWHVALSGIIRVYIERRFGVRAPEMTTEEFMQAMQRDSPLSADHRRVLGEFLAECDLVKFARHVPTVEDAERGYEAARRFVGETRITKSGEDRRAA